MSSGPPDADSEAALLDRVEGALAGADEAGLARLAAALLVPSLAKLTSPHAATRNRVPTVLQHFLARIRPAEAVALPLPDLVALWAAQAAGAPFVLLFVDLAWRRAPHAQRVAQLASLMAGFAARPAALQSQVFQLFLLALPLPEDAWAPQPADRDAWLTHVEHFLLLPAGAVSGPAPGLSLAQARHVAGKRGAWPTEELATTKAALVRLLTSAAFDATEVHCAFLIGAADPHHAVVSAAEDALRRARLGQHVQLESLVLVDRLLALYLGAGEPATPDEQRVPPAAIALKLRLLGELGKSVAAAGRFPRVLQVLFDAVFSAQSSARLRLAGMAFLQWLARHAPVGPLRQLAPLLLTQLLKFVDATADAAQRAAAYDALGLLARRAPAPFAADAALLPRLFSALAEEGVRQSVRDALTLAASAFADPPPERAGAIEALLLSAVEDAEPTARFAAVFCALRIFPFAHPPARLVCLLASADARADVRDEAARGLRPYVRKEGEPQGTPAAAAAAEWPSFAAMVRCVHAAVQARPVPADVPLAAPAPVYEAALAFLAECLTHEAAAAHPADPLLAPARLLAALLSGPHASALAAFEALATPLLHAALPASAHAAALKALTLVASSLPEPAPHLHALVAPSVLLRLLASPRPDVREDAARLLGLVSAADAPLVGQLLALAAAPATAPEALHGATVALGAALAVRRPAPLDGALAGQVVARLAALTRSTVPLVAASACTSLGQVGRRAPLPLPRGDGPDAPADPPSQWGVLRLLSDLLSGADRRVAERAGGALGVLAGAGQRDEAMAAAVQSALVAQAAEKQEDVQLTIGEALALLAAGLSATCARDALLDGPVPPPAPPTDSRAESVLRAAMALAASPLAPVRCSASVWLLCLLQHAGATAAIAALTGEACTALAGLLGDVQELTSEAAARALVVAYERATDEAQRSALLAQLMRSLTGSGAAPQAPKRAAESEVFAEGALGQAPDGSALSTYRELSSLAADTGQPELLYKMLGMAQHHALWTSRRAAAFAATAIASRADAAAQMQAHLPVLLPRLFRSSHDPAPRVAQATAGILKTLAPDLRRAVAQHLNAVLADLVPSMGAREWRVRQAAAAATAEAVSGAGLAELAPWLERLWTMAFRVADDVKESVRGAGLALLRTLISLSVRLCDPHHSPPDAVTAALALLIPFLLSKGLVAETKEARAATLLALQKLAKVAGALIAPHVPELSAVLLESLSAHESATVSYAVQHVASLGIDPAQLEAARVAAAAASPAAETLDLCVRHASAATMPALVARLASLIQSGVGLPTRAATSRFLLSLVRTHRDLCEGQLGRLLRPLLAALRERSAAVRRGFAAAAAVVASTQGGAAVRECVEWLTNRWLGEADEAEQLAAPVLLLELCKADAPRCRAHPPLLALCLLAMQDLAEEARKAGAEAWSDLGGWPSDAAVQAEVLATLRVALGGASWTLRRHAALALNTLAVERRIGAPAATELMGVCTEAMGGRAWAGKEAVYEAAAALALVASPGGEALEASAAHAATAAALWRDATRGEKKLRTAALAALAVVLRHRPPAAPAPYADMRAALAPLLQAAPEHAGDSADAVEERAEGLKLREQAVAALSAAFPAAASNAAEAAAHAALLASVRLTNPWQISAMALRGLVMLVERGAPLSAPLVAAAAEAIVAGLGDTKYSAVRNSASALVTSINAKDAAALTPYAAQISAAMLGKQPPQQAQQ